MSIQKISAINFRTTDLSAKNTQVQPKKLSLPKELSKDSVNSAKVAFKAIDCGKLEATLLGACVSLGVGVAS